jgi:hypothetical protein
VEPSKPSVSLPRNQFIALILGVCVLSAAIGSGLALLAQTGPSGTPGKQGPRGHVGTRGPEGREGPEGESAEAELGAVEGEIEELRDQVEESDPAEVEGRLEELEEEVAGISASAQELCGEVEFFC